MTVVRPQAGRAQRFETNPQVVLWKLDTTTVGAIHGTSQGGQIYRWTAGPLSSRQTGVLPVLGTTTVLTFDAVLPINPGLRFVATVESGVGVWNAPVNVAAWGTTTLGGYTVTTALLAAPLAAAPGAGARWELFASGSVFFAGEDYAAIPFEAVDFEWNGTGKLPRPKLRIPNAGGYAAALIETFGSLEGATVTRLRVLKVNLDGEQYADPTAMFEPDVYTIDRESDRGRDLIEFELAASFDQQGVMLPKRQVIRDTCTHSYRVWSSVSNSFVYGTCPYVGGSFWKPDDTTTGDHALDDCGRRLSSCRLRFGTNSKLYTRAFPGAGLAKQL